MRETFATFSITAVDLATGDLGIAVATRRPAVGNRVPFVRGSVGAVATQARTNQQLAVDTLAAMAEGAAPEEAIRRALADDPEPQHRQMGVVDRAGRAAAHTGGECVDVCGHVVGDGFVAAGNMLANDGVLPAVAAAFRATSGELVDRLLAALEAGERAGGDKRGKQSAALIVVRQGLITYIDLRVDDHPEPVKELRRLFHLYDAEVLHPQGLHLHDRPPEAGQQDTARR